MKPIDDKFLDECARITSEYDKLMGSWSLDSGILHVITELAELKNVLRNKNDKYGKTLSPEWYEKFYDEIADIHLTTFSLDNLLNKLGHPNGIIKLSNDDLNNAIMKKLRIVNQRVITLTQESKSENQ